ncbi:RlpA-like double-psi beta-barrel-protein domain-containing protein-containing protein [Flagelloscypha sp. PMI_526]|nr:RlpA-like double-psi beta-barrel-protein domain-containing protein-containing protein [Flagelloscypha sp. PMI_526]
MFLLPYPILLLLTFLSTQFELCSAWLSIPNSGMATMTHYDLPLDYITACGCTTKSTHYPTAALSQMAFGSSNAYGPGCGRCFRLGLVDTWVSDPPYILTDSQRKEKQLVVKVTDLCPMNGNGWCSANASSTNPGGAYLNFDLAFPSPNGAIPSDWFPSNESFYGFTDFGVWNVTFEQVSCVDQWAGGKDGAALGSVEGQGPESVCCPKDPLTNSSSVCPSYSDANGIAYVFFPPFFLPEWVEAEILDD